MVASLGSIPLASPLQNPVLSGFQQMMGAAQQAQQMQYAPLQQMLAMRQAMAMANMYGAKGNYYNASADKNNVQANAIANGSQSGLGQQILTLRNNGATPQQIQDFINAYAQKPVVQNEQGLASAGNQNAQAQLAQQREAYVQAQIKAGIPEAQAREIAARTFASIAQGVGTSTTATNDGADRNLLPPVPQFTGGTPQQPNVPTGGTISQTNPNLPGLISNLQQTIGNMNTANPNAATATPNQQASQSLPQGSFTLWKPEDQDNYIQNNNTPPPLPPGAITKEIDAKTIARINGMAPTAQSINFMQQGLNNPQISPYIGNSAQAIANRASAQALARVGKAPQAYSDYLSFEKNAQALISDTVATTQTGSRSFGMMQQFLKVFDPSSQVTLAQAKSAINNAGSILYDEGKTYVGSPYAPGLRTAAYNGVKLLSNYGFGGKQSPSNSSTPQAGMSKDQFIQWRRSQGAK